MTLIKILTALIFVADVTASIFAQADLGARLRQMQRRQNQDPKSYVSNMPNTVQRSFEFEKIRRTFLVHTPPGYDGETALPLVLNFHGGLGTGKQQEEKTAFSQLANKQNFIVVYPDGVNNQWNDGRGAAFSGAPTANDIGFVAALIDFMKKNYRVDPRRVYATGGSNGGIFCHRLGVELSDKFAAIAPVIANLPIDPKSGKPFAPQAGKTKQLSVLMINGTDDSFVRWEGGRVRGSEGRVTSVAETVAAWTASNGCQAPPQVQSLPDKFADDGTTVRRETHADCRNKTEVILYAIEGGGHGWHGATAARSKIFRKMMGNLSREINSTEVIWEFFQKHPKQ